MSNIARINSMFKPNLDSKYKIQGKKGNLFIKVSLDLLNLSSGEFKKNSIEP